MTVFLYERYDQLIESGGLIAIKLCMKACQWSCRTTFEVVIIPNSIFRRHRTDSWSSFWAELRGLNDVQWYDIMVNIIDPIWYMVGMKLFMFHGWDEVITAVDYATKLLSLQSWSSGDEYHSYMYMYCSPDGLQCRIAMFRETFVLDTTKVIFSDDRIWVP